MAADERIQATETFKPEATHFVDLRQYLELLVSRRKLDVVSSGRDWLRDRESSELFVLQGPSDASVEQSV
jgi:hypothetical protein